MSFFGSLFGSHSNPYSKAIPEIEKIPGQLHQYYDPYVDMGNAGREQLGDLNQRYDQMASMPGQYQAQLGEGFRADPGYAWNRNQQLDAQNRALAAGGMVGTPENQQFAQQLASNLADQEYGNYLNRNLGIATQGLQGLQGVANTNLGYGYNASSQMANNMRDYYQTLANLKAQKKAYQTNQNQGLLGAGLSLGSSAIHGLGKLVGVL